LIATYGASNRDKDRGTLDDTYAEECVRGNVNLPVAETAQMTKPNDAGKFACAMVYKGVRASKPFFSESR
jgi:hypothetical protein